MKVFTDAIVEMSGRLVFLWTWKMTNALHIAQVKKILVCQKKKDKNR